MSNLLCGGMVLHGVGLGGIMFFGRLLREGLFQEVIFRVRPVRSEGAAMQRGWG